MTKYGEWWSSTPTVDIVYSSKKLVDDLLACNTSNRKVRTSHVALLASSIKAGNYKLIASGIGISKTGVLMDGQHRLLAIKECGYPKIPIILAQGLEDDSQLVVDRHAKRSMADALSLYLNQSVTSNIVAIVNALYEVGGAAIFVYCTHNLDGGMEFAEQVNTGINLAQDSPAYRLRQTMDRLKTSNGAVGRMVLFKSAASAVIAHARGRSIGLLKGSDSWASAPWKWELDAP
jgi:hypothetical protein